MPEPSRLRISDEDRERVGAEMREHFAAGRLTSDELDERLAALYRARTEDELDELRADLPPLPLSPAQRRAAMVERRAELRRQVVQQTGGAMLAFVVCVAVWAASGASGGFWPGWVALAVLIPLVRNGWRLYGPAPDFESVERELEHRRHHHRHRHRRHRRRLER